MLVLTPTAHAVQGKNDRPNAGSAKLDIVLVAPGTLTTGESAFAVTVKDANGKPVADADVSVALMLPAAPATNMPELRNAVKLKSASGGKYTGSATALITGNWDVTVTVKKEQKEIGQKKVAFAVK